MSPSHLPGILKLAGIIGLSIGSLSANAQPNLLTDLGVGFGFGLNDNGQAVLSAGLYSNGVVTALGMNGYAINASGQVAGETTTAGHAALYSNGVVTDLGVLPGGNMANGNTEAFGINSSAQVVGLGLNGTGTIDAFSYSNGTMTDLGWLPGAAAAMLSSEAYAVNDSGLITGISVSSANTPLPTYDAFIYDHGTYTDLGPGAAYAINAGGQITGVLTTDPAASEGDTTPVTGHAFLYDNGTTADLGVLKGGTISIGYALNATGQVVGNSNLTGSPNAHAFFYNGVMTDLNSLIDVTDPLKQYVTLTDARGINAGRLILASGIDSRTHQQHAYLLQGPWIDIAPGALSFPAQAVGTTSSAEPVVLTNSGTAPVAIGSMSMTGDFAQTNDCGASLAPAGQCTVMVTFTPTVAGNLTGSLTVSAGGQPFVVALSGVAPLKVTLSASAPSVTTGTAFTLTWTQSPGASCAATGGMSGDGWAGTFAASGNHSVTESAAGMYQFGLACTAGSQTAAAQASVNVTLPPVTVTLSAAPTSIVAGQSTTLTWKSSNATSCVAVGGSPNDVWPGTKATSGTQAVLESGAGSFQYALTCTAGSQIAEAQVTVIVALPPVIVTLSASPAAITAGQSTTLTWSSTNATGCTATGGSPNDTWPGTKATSGSQVVVESAAGSFHYTLTCATGAQSGAALATVTVAWPPVTVTLSASPTTITAGQSTMLTWSSTNATGCTATGGAAGDGWAGTLSSTGSLNITEPAAGVAMTQTLVFGITCTSSQSNLSAQTTASVVENPPPKSGGGGIDGLAIFLLFGLSCINWRRRTASHYSNHSTVRQGLKWVKSSISFPATSHRKVNNT
jgi:probable HAF family extracellular repeat protein